MEQLPLPGGTNPFEFDGGGSPGGGGGGGSTGPFIPTFSGGQGGGALGFAGFGQAPPWSPFRRIMGQGQMVRNQRQAAPFSGGAGLGGGMPIGPGVPIGNMSQWLQQQQQPSGPFNPQNEQFNSVMDILNNLVTHGVRGDAPGYGGAYSLNPPSSIMNAIRGQAIQDAGAQERAARLGLQSSGADPSTYGFQALMSQLQGQRNVSNAMNQADLGLRQQQLQNYWNLLNQLLGSQTSQINTEVAGRWQHANQPSGWSQALGGLGGLAGAFFGAPGGGAGGLPIGALTQAAGGNGGYTPPELRR